LRSDDALHALPLLPEVLRIHHVGLVVRDAEAAADTYQRALGLEAVALEEFRGTARVAFLRMGETLLELIQPLTDDTPWASALRQQGEGPHHVALEVADLHGAMRAVVASGVGLLDTRPARAPGNTLSVFLDPATTGGILIELVQQIQV
jgi:methylmalonyl-CoA epimerase